MKQKAKKVYLSVSYNTSTTLIKQTEKLLQSMGVEVLMYIKGTTYTSDKLLSVDLVLGLPPEDTYQDNCIKDKDIQYNVSVGRGQYNEADTAIENDIPYFMLTRGLNQFSKFSSMYTNMPDNWKKDYGNIVIKGSYFLEELLLGKEESNLLLIL